MLRESCRFVGTSHKEIITPGYKNVKPRFLASAFPEKKRFLAGGFVLFFLAVGLCPTAWYRVLVLWTNTQERRTDKKNPPPKPPRRSVAGPFRFFREEVPGNDMGTASGSWSGVRVAGHLSKSATRRRNPGPGPQTNESGTGRREKTANGPHGTRAPGGNRRFFSGFFARAFREKVPGRKPGKTATGTPKGAF